MVKDWNVLLRPRNWDEVIGQDALMSVLKNLVETYALPSFSIFYGKTGGGKSSVAELVAKATLCSSDVVPCNTCRSCQSADNGRNPYIIKCDTPNMTDAEIGELIHQIFNVEHSSETVYIIEEAHVMHKQNCQPKWLEPLMHIPEKVHIIFCTTQLMRLISELRGRAQIYRFDVPTEEDCMKLLERMSRVIGFTLPEVNVQKQFIQMNGNSPRGIIGSMETFAMTESMGPEQMRRFFRIQDSGAYEEILLDLLDNNVSTFEFSRNLKTLNIAYETVIFGLKPVVTSAVLSISFGEADGINVEAFERLQLLINDNIERRLLKIVDSLSNLHDITAYSEDDLQFELIALKLRLMQSSGAASIATESKAEASKAAMQSRTSAMHKAISANAVKNPASVQIQSASEITKLMNGG